jgi:hypothetical protein
MPGSLREGGTCVMLDVLSRGIPDSLVPRTVISIPNRGSMGTAWSVSALLGHHFVCLGLPCKVLNQSIVGLSPLSETV